MALTIEQALQQGIAKHKAGKVQDAERLYRAILQSQPAHPDANHNLGLLAVSFNKADAALPLFKIALEANPKIEQFWLSYIDALMKEQQFDNAKQVLEQAKKRGLVRDKFNAFEAQLASIYDAENAACARPSQEQISNLLERYQNGRFDEAEKLATSITQEYPTHPFSWKVLGAVFKQTGRTAESLTPIQISAQLAPQDAEAQSNLGSTLQELGRSDEALASYTQAIALKPELAEAHYNLGVTLKQLGRLDEAEASYTQAIALKPDNAEAHSNLGNTLKELGRLEEAEASYMQAIALKPDLAEVHHNLGITLQELGRLEEAEASDTQAIALKPDFAEAHSNLGATLQELGRLDEAEASCRRAILLKFDLAKAHSLLGCLMHKKGDADSALHYFEKAFKFDSNLRINKLRLMALKSRGTRGWALENSETHSKFDSVSKLCHNPLIVNRAVEIGLIDKLYKMASRTLDNTKDARFGKGSCSPNFQFFEDESSIIKTVSSDLIRIMSDAVKSKVYVYDSFFNILGAGGGTHPHAHVNAQDNVMDLWKQKYSLVYYLSVGDQDCNEPGILKLYSPDEDILPCEGMVVIVPATRQHSALYNGKIDRVMIGVNFYAL